MKKLLTYDLLAYKFAVYAAIWDWERDNTNRWAKAVDADRDQLDEERSDLLRQRDVIKGDIDKIIAEDATDVYEVADATRREILSRAPKIGTPFTPAEYAASVMRDTYTGPVWEDSTIIGLDANGSPNGYVESFTKGTEQ